MAAQKTKNSKNVVFLYVTCPSTRVAKRIALALINKNLIACANIIPRMESIYPWNGKIESSREVVMILKTVSNKVVLTEKTVALLHPYEVPCIGQIKLAGLNQGYKRWLMNNLK